MNNDNFSIDRTNFCKGAAIILLVIHHLFWDKANIGVMIGDVSLLQRIATTGKVCASIFLMLSAIGLSKITTQVDFSNKREIKNFYKRKLGKLYKNYIFIVLTSTIVSIIFFDYMFTIMVGSGFHRFIMVILNCTGIQYLIGYPGFNGAWWFTSSIMACYILFPWLKKMVCTYKIKFLIVAFILSLGNYIPTGRIQILTILSWILPFIVGIYINEFNILSRGKRYIEEKSTFLKKSILFIILISAFVIRQEMPSQSPYGIKFDVIISIISIFSVHVFWDNMKCLHKGFCYLGKKSMDIYYIHMFISNYYLGDFIYGLNNGVVMIIAVMGMSIAYSYFLDFIRIMMKKASIYVEDVRKVYYLKCNRI